MGLAPILIQWNGSIARQLGRMSQRFAIAPVESAIRDERRNLEDHVVLCGCGRVGGLVAVVLEAAKLPYKSVTV